MISQSTSDFRDDRVVGVAAPQERHQAADEEVAEVGRGAAQAGAPVAASEKAVVATGAEFSRYRLFITSFERDHLSEILNANYNSDR